jgi:hypothetical protein
MPNEENISRMNGRCTISKSFERLSKIGNED